MRIVTLDIETAPKLAYVWRMFKENIGAKQIQNHGSIMSFAAVFDNEDEVVYAENRKLDAEAEITRDLIKVLDEADVVIGQNVERFDIGTINAFAVKHGIKPPSPYRVVDTMQVAKKNFKLESYSLEYMLDFFQCNYQKLAHAKFPGFLLWQECLKGNPEAWEEMKVYNVRDTLATRELYKKMLPYIKNHPNLGVFAEADVPVCPKCGSVHMVKRGYYHTNVSKFQRYRCGGCGGWARTRYNEYDKDKRRALLVNAQ